MKYKILLALAFALLIWSAGCIEDSYVDSTRAIFIEATYQDSNQVPHSIKIVLNPDKTGSVGFAQADVGSQGTWEFQESTDVVKVVLKINNENTLLTLYKNKEAGISASRIQMFGHWYQE